MALNLVDILAECANPLLAHFNKLYKRVDVSSAFFTAYNGLVIEVSERNRLSRGKLTERFYYDCQRNRRFLCHLCRAWNAICGNSQNRLVRVEVIHCFAFKRSHLLREIRGSLYCRLCLLKDNWLLLDIWLWLAEWLSLRLLGSLSALWYCKRISNRPLRILLSAVVKRRGRHFLIWHVVVILHLLRVRISIH